MTSEDSSSPPAPAPRLWALIPCAGSGSRALSSLSGGERAPLAKQYHPLAGQPLVLHTLAAFAAVRRLAGTLVVVAPGDDFFRTAPVDCRVAPVGGATRAQSVTNGLQYLAEHGGQPQDWVLVHDAARCLVTPQLINALIDACLDDEVGGLLAHKLPDTLKREVAGRVAGTLRRDDKWLAQTPQMFRLGQLSQALALAGEQVTDEAGAIETMGLNPKLVPGSAQNFKVTYPPDFELAEVVLLGRRQCAAHNEEAEGRAT
jgi:2-C-methyl-D-erythritol 4-phosphate cytidylyltransferase